jgi:hypothetical protein
MNLDWQNFAALAVVLVAAVFLTRRLWRAMASGKPLACSGCRSGGPKDSAEELISVEPLSSATKIL